MSCEQLCSHTEASERSDQIGSRGSKANAVRLLFNNAGFTFLSLIFKTSVVIGKYDRPQGVPVETFQKAYFENLEKAACDNAVRPYCMTSAVPPFFNK